MKDKLSFLKDLTASCTISYSYMIGYKSVDEEIRCLIETLETNTSLTFIDLGPIDIGDNGAWHFSETLKENTTLTSLALGENNVGNEGALYLSEVLKINTILTSLALEFNCIGDAGAKYLVEALKSNSSLKKLTIYDNKITQKIEKTINDCIAINNGSRIEEFKELALCLKGYHLPEELIDKMYYSHYITYKKSKLIEDNFMAIAGADADHSLTEG